MIRQLKPGEIIKEGDFCTEDECSDGIRIPVHGQSHGEKFNPDEFYQVFREIPDKLEVIDLHKFKILWTTNFFMENWKKEDAKKFSLWLGEIAEAME